ncbi:MAG: glycosyltransferase family 2 protein [Verrucomicrobiae bacterium]
MKPDHITPMILTWNEEDNIGRCLERLEWAQEVLVVDSFSTDRTLEICSEFAGVRVVQHPFASLAGQANFGMSQISTPWVLSLDADYILPEEFIASLEGFDATDLNGASAGFTYCVFGKPLRGTLYPPRIVLHRTKDVYYFQDGHAHRVHVTGEPGELDVRIDHDDRKPLARWFASQSGYARLEAEKLLSGATQELSRQDRIRMKAWIAPWLVAFWCLFVRRCALDGRAGLYYTFQRMIAETMLAVCLLDAWLRGRKP